MLSLKQSQDIISKHIDQATAVVGYNIWDVAKYVLYLDNPHKSVNGSDYDQIVESIENVGGVQALGAK